MHSINWIIGFGFIAQSLFGARTLIQWWIAERRNKIVSPRLFWSFSLGGSALFLIYGMLRQDFVIIFGQLISYFIYIRNLQLKQAWREFPLILRSALVLLPFGCLILIFINAGSTRFTSILRNINAFFILGLVGQFLLSIRFVYQMIYSERRKESLLPIGFWWISIGGSILVVTYAIYNREPVLLVAQGLAFIPYVRNILIGNRQLKEIEDAA
jgi:lipid-A-disaccharide synthase-like uncharacterized protein